MVNCPPFSRAVLLALSLLPACAAANAGDPPAGAASRPVVGASGAFLVGRYAMSRTDLDVATDDFLKALAADPQNTDLRQQAFSAALLVGRPEAVSLARKLPSDPAAQLVLAGQDVRARNWAGAEAKFAALPGQGLTQVLQPLLLAWAQQGGGATDRALNTLRPYVEGTRYRGVFALHAAMINDMAGREADAARLYHLALVEFGSLNLRLGSIVGSWQARNGHGADARATIRAMTDGSSDLAIAEPALELAAGQPQAVTASDGIAEAYLALAATLQQQEASDFSLLLLRLALDLKPGFTSARLLMADIQSAGGQLDAASATLAVVPPTDPLIAVVQMRQARLNERLGHMADAQRILEQVAQDNPQRPEPLTQLADMQTGQGQYAEATATYGRAIARVTRPVRSDWTLFYQRGVAYDHAHEWPPAEADFQRALELSPDQPFVLNYLAYAWAEQGRNLPRARQMIERAASLRPNEGAILDSLGWVMLLQGDKTGAIRWLERAVELLPEDSTINGHLGDAYAAVGRRMEAQTQWRRALILNPEPQEAMKLQAKLAGAAPAAAATTAERRVE
jgi:tetratricopeptide (TPR) repeat protein